MKQFIKMQLAAALIFTLSFSSCSKKDTPKPDNKTLLTAKTWAVAKFGYDDNDNNIIDIEEIQTVPAGVDFASIKFLEDGSGTQVIGGISLPFTWQLVDQKTIILKLPDTYFLHIKMLSSKEFDFDEFDSDDKLIQATFKCVPK